MAGEPARTYHIFRKNGAWCTLQLFCVPQLLNNYCKTKCHYTLFSAMFSPIHNITDTRSTSSITPITMKNTVFRPAPNVLENPPIILSSTAQKNAYYSLIPVQYLLFLYYSFLLYCRRLLLEMMETISTSCQLKMRHIIIVIIIIIIIWVIFEIDSLRFTKITSRSIARTWPSTIEKSIPR